MTDPYPMFIAVRQRQTQRASKSVDHPVRIGKPDAVIGAAAQPVSCTCRRDTVLIAPEWLGDRARGEPQDVITSATGMTQHHSGHRVMLIAHSAAQPEWTATRFSSTQYPKGPRTFL